MNILSFTYLAVGRNRVTLFARMEREGVDLIKLHIIDENTAEITVSAKDRLKYFAICENICYNTLIRTGGIIAPFYNLFCKPWLVLAAVLFVFAVCFGDNIYLESEYVGDSVIYSKEIEAALNNAGVVRFRTFSKGQLQLAENILDDTTDLSFVKIEKSGNKAIITTFGVNNTPNKVACSDKNIVAESDCRVLKISAYSGTSLVSEGEYVSKGQTIIEAVRVLKDGRRIPCTITGYVLTEEEFVYRHECRFAPDDQAVVGAVSVAKFLLGDHTVTRYRTEIDEKDVVVTLYYERVLFGNEFFGG